jgi:hypothetical protein
MLNINLQHITTSSKLKIVFVIAIGLFFIHSPSAHAATISVSGTCSLDNAILSANTNTATGGCTAGDPGLDTVSIPSGTITLTGNLQIYSEQISFVGAGIDNTIIDANHTTGTAFSNSGLTPTGPEGLSVDGITFKNFGLLDGSSKLGVIIYGDQAGIANSPVTIRNCKFLDNYAAGTPGNPNSLIYLATQADVIIENIDALNTTLDPSKNADDVGFNAISSLTPSNLSITNVSIQGTHTQDGVNVIADQVFSGVATSSRNLSITNYTVSGSRLYSDDGYEVGIYGVVNPNNNSNWGAFALDNFRFNDNQVENRSAIAGDIFLAGVFGLWDVSASFRNIDIRQNLSSSIFASPNSFFVGLYLVPASGPASIDKYSFTDNHNDAGGIGVGVFIGNGSPDNIDITNSTISTNDNFIAIAYGFNVDSGILDISNSTIADNAVTDPSLISQLPPGSATVLTFDGGGGGGGHPDPASRISLQNTILSNNTIIGAPSNCSTNNILTSQGHNLSSDATCSAVFNQTGDLNNTDPLLNPLSTPAGSFGAMRTLQAGSPAIDTGKTIPAITTDQRGQSRPQGSAYDIGAHEYVLSATTVSPDSDVTAPNTGAYVKVAKTALVLVVIFAAGIYVVRRRLSLAHIRKK